MGEISIGKRKKQKMFNSEYTNLNKCIKCDSENLNVVEKMVLYDDFKNEEFIVDFVKMCNNCDCIHYELDGIFTYEFDCVEKKLTDNIAGWLDPTKS